MVSTVLSDSAYTPKTRILTASLFQSSPRDLIEEPSDNAGQDQHYKRVLVCLKPLLGLLLACAVIAYAAIVGFGAAVLHYPSITHTYRRHPWSAAPYSPTPPFLKAARCGSAISSPMIVPIVATRRV